MLRNVLLTVIALIGVCPTSVHALDDDRGESISRWLNDRIGEQDTKGAPKCDDLVYLRRVYLDILGRVPSVSETRDYLEIPQRYRRNQIVDTLLYPTGDSAPEIQRASARHWSRVWERILLPTTTADSPQSGALKTWLNDRFVNDTPFNRMASDLLIPGTSEAGRALFAAAGGSPETYVTQISRALLGVRIECTQCHNHPFTSWKQADFWGLAAFYSNVSPARNPSTEPLAAGTIVRDGVTYQAKVLWDDKPALLKDRTPEAFARWVTSDDNPQFAATAVNRIWEQLLGRGLFASVDDLDTAKGDQRELLDGLAEQFRSSGYSVRKIVAGICKSIAYQVAPDGESRSLKSLTPEQVFDSLEQALLLPVGRTDASAARFNGLQSQMVSRFQEGSSKRPSEYAAGIPQALMLMNGRVTTDAISLDHSRLLRAVIDAPFIKDTERVDTLYLAVLTRHPNQEEKQRLAEYLKSKATQDEWRHAHGEILWALINSPEFVLCR